MKEIELYVTLLIPDTTAVTAANTLRKLGFKFENLKRADYYRFTIDGDAKSFKERIAKVDVLVNANKHKADMEPAVEGVIVTATDDKCEGMLNTLKNRLGFKEIKSMHKGTYWLSDSEELTIKMTEALLYNPNFQTYEVRG